MPPEVAEFIANLTPLVIGGVPVAILVFLVVQALAAAELIVGALAKQRAVLVTATIFAGVWTFRVLSEAPAVSTALVIDTAVIALTGALVASIIHSGWDALRERLLVPKT